jgi:L-threonylcarbamoyladenylate synthase
MGLILKFKKAQQASWGLFLNHAFNVYKDSDILIYPNGKVYYMGGNPFDLMFLNTLGQFYTDPFHIGIPIIVDSIKTAEKFITFSPLTKKIVKQFWPGNLTIILPAKEHISIKTPQDTFLLPDSILLNKQIAIEINNHPVLLAFFDKLKKEGYPPAIVAIPVEIQPGVFLSDTNPIIDFLGGNIQHLIMDAGRLDKGGVNQPSTIIRIFQEQIELIKEGSILYENIEGSVKDTNKD